MTKITSLLWDTYNRTHIQKHKVSCDEVEEALGHVGTHNFGYGNRIILIGRSGKRLLAIV